MGYIDIIEKWKVKNSQKEPKITISDRYIAPDGNTYIVDGKNVIMDRPNADEWETAEIVSCVKNAKIEFQPRVNEPAEIRSPDCKVDGVPYEIKTSRGKGSNAYKNIVKTGEGQSNRIILNLNHSPLSKEERERQIEGLLSSKYLNFMDELVIIIDGKVDRVYKRK